MKKRGRPTNKELKRRATIAEKKEKRVKFEAPEIDPNAPVTMWTFQDNPLKAQYTAGIIEEGTTEYFQQENKRLLATIERKNGEIDGLKCAMKVLANQAFDRIKENAY